MEFRLLLVVVVVVVVVATAGGTVVVVVVAVGGTDSGSTTSAGRSSSRLLATETLGRPAGSFSRLRDSIMVGSFLMGSRAVDFDSAGLAEASARLDLIVPRQKTEGG